MATRAQGPIGKVAQVEAMRLMAVRACGFVCMKSSLGAGFLMTFRALLDDLRRALRIRVVAAGTVALVFRMMGRGNLVVTALASLVSRPPNRMGAVTTAAVAVLRGTILRQDGRLLMTRGTTKCSRR